MGSSFFTRSPFQLGFINSLMCPTSVATTGTPKSIASRMAPEIPSYSLDEQTTTEATDKHARISCAGPTKETDAIVWWCPSLTTFSLQSLAIARRRRSETGPTHTPLTLRSLSARMSNDLMKVTGSLYRRTAPMFRITLEDEITSSSGWAGTRAPEVPLKHVLCLIRCVFFISTIPSLVKKTHL